MLGRVGLEGTRPVNSLIGPQTTNANHPAVGLADVGQPLRTHVGGLLAPLAVPMLVYDQNAFVVGGGSGVFEQEFEPALVDLLGIPPRFREEPLQALRFLSLRSYDRLVYPNYESLITLAAAAAVTERVRLMTTVLIAPLRGAGVLAKQAATLDALSGGRLTLGLGVGAREDDFRFAPASFHDRGRRFEEQLELMKGVWSGQPVSDEIGPVGPPPARPGGPELLIGGYTPVSIQRVGRWGDGFISGGVRDAE